MPNEVELRVGARWRRRYPFPKEWEQAGFNELRIVDAEFAIHGQVIARYPNRADLGDRDFSVARLREDYEYQPLTPQELRARFVAIVQELYQTSLDAWRWSSRHPGEPPIVIDLDLEKDGIDPALAHDIRSLFERLGRA